MKRSKEISILEVLADGGSLNRLQAIRHGDTSLNSTISNLKSKHNLNFIKVSEMLDNAHGGKTRYIRYSLQGEDLDHARNIIRRHRAQLNPGGSINKRP